MDHTMYVFSDDYGHNIEEQPTDKAKCR